MKHPGRATGVIVVLVAVCTMLLGGLHKSLCFGEEFPERSVTLACYSDFIPLYEAEELDAGRFPYVQAANEYPVGTGIFMWLTSLPASDPESFFVWNAVALGVLGLATTWLLYRMVGVRAFYFAAAPTLALYAFLNWDLLAVTLMTAGVVAYLRRRDVASGILLGLGAAAKLFPSLIVPPLVIERARGGSWRRAVPLVASAALVWLAVNLPVALMSPSGWGFTFRFNSERPVHWATLWFVGCRVLPVVCRNVPLVNVLSLAMFIAAAIGIWAAKSRSEPGFPMWTLGFPILIVFLLTNKVYSPQYSLWLLPWFALVLPKLWAFLAFEAADLFVFVTEFRFLGTATGQVPSFPRWLFLSAVLVRAGVLLLLLVEYLRSDTSRLAPRRPSAGSRRSEPVASDAISV